MHRKLTDSGSLAATASANHDLMFASGRQCSVVGARVVVRVKANDKTGAGSINVTPLLRLEDGSVVAETAAAATGSIGIGATGAIAVVVENDGAPIAFDGLRVGVTAGTGGAANMTYDVMVSLSEE